MNLSDNLKRIRKENNLSQEQLADKLGVSRQAVSKWESNQAYPEMDKVLQICKMFNLNIDELLNQNIKEVNETKQSKNNVNKFIDDFLDYITKTVDMFSSMKLKEQLKCILEQLVIIGVITLILLILGVIVKNIVSSILNFLPESLYYTLYNILINGVYVLLCLVLGVSLVLHIFKIRYLDYYVIVKEKKEEVIEETITEETNVKEEKKKRKFFSKPEREKIIIREPKHSGYKFISTMVKFLLLILKSFAVLIASLFCASLVAFVIMLTLSVLFVKTGALFIGAFIILIASIIVNLVILNILYCYIIDKKRNTKLLGTSFLVSLIMIGVGTGISLIGIKDFNIVNTLDNSRYIQVEETLEMKDNSYFRYYGEENFIETDSKDIKIVITHTPFMEYELNQYENGHIELWYHRAYDMGFKEVRTFIDDINNKRIVDYYNFDVKIYTSKENIKKLKENKEKIIQEETEYYNHIEELNSKISELETENYNYQNEIENLKYQIEYLKSQNEETIE